MRSPASAARRGRSPTSPSPPARRRSRTLGYGVSDELEAVRRSRRRLDQEVRQRHRRAEIAYTNDDLDFGLPNGIAPGGHRDEGRRRRPHHRLPRPERHEDAGAGDEAPGHGGRDAVPHEHLRPDLREGRRATSSRATTCMAEFRPFEIGVGSSSLDAVQGVDGQERQRRSPSWRWTAGSTPTWPTRASRPPGPNFDRPVGDRRHQQDDRLHRRRAHPADRLVPPARGPDPGRPGDARPKCRLLSPWSR